MTTCDNIAVTVYVLRASIASRWLILSQIAALCICGAALLLLVEGSIVLGGGLALTGLATSWLAGVWVLPRGEDAYLRKLSTIMRDAHTELWFDRFERREKLKAAVATLEQLTPPPYSHTQKHILGVLHGLDDTMMNKTVPFPERARMVFGQSRLLVQARGQLDDDEVYGRLAGEILDNYRRATVESMKESEALLQRQAMRMTKIKPPSRWRAHHNAFVLALTNYAGALRDYYEVARGDNDEAVERAVTALVAMYTELEFERQRYVEEFSRIGNPRRLTGVAKCS